MLVKSSRYAVTPGVLACGVFIGLFVWSNGLHAEPASQIHFSGPVVSATGTMPTLAAFADCEGHPRIPGVIKDGKYQLDLPPETGCTVIVGERDWESQPQPVFDAARSLALPILVYPREVPEPALAKELIDMGAQDQAVRHAKIGSQDSPAARQAAAEDAARRLRLEAIIAAKGWPTMSMVGFEAANAAWLIAQHAPPEELARTKAWLALMKAAAAKHEIFPVNLATSIDRVLVYENKPQIYGTQFRPRTNGTTEPFPIGDMAHLDERRQAMGLPPFAEHLKLMNRSATGPAAQP